jgi:hypothetical protein
MRTDIYASSGIRSHDTSVRELKTHAIVIGDLIILSSIMYPQQLRVLHCAYFRQLRFALMMEASSTSETSANFYQDCAASQKTFIFILAAVRT